MSTPHWFRDAVNAPRTSHHIDVAGCRIHYDAWQVTEGLPGLLFVHGHGAHSHWWDFIAPALSDRFNAFAIDLSGAGDSGHRDQYTAVTFANEIIEACRHAGHGETIVVGHSFGGSMSRVAGYLHGDELRAVVLVDSALSSNRGSRRPPPRPSSGTRARFYSTLDEGKRRFRLRPPQPCSNDYILDYIAGHSLKQTDAGFCFKLDQSLFAKMQEDPNVALPDAISMIGAIPCPVSLIYADQSRFFPPAHVATLQDAFVPGNLREIKNAHHHVFLDQPEKFVTVLGEVLASLPAS